MNRKIVAFSLALLLLACGIGRAAPAKSGFAKIGDIADAWSNLYKQNEAVINKWEGMPIMALVTPPTTFIATVQFDLLNTGSKDGRFEGKLMLAGYKGFVEKSGAKIAFGYDDKLVKNGFGPTAKAGDRLACKGSLDLAKEFYIAETFTERAGKKIVRSYTEFKRLGDGSMICLAQNGHTLNMRGDPESADDVVYLHNGKDRYDFVVAKGKSGCEFKAVSFADKGDLTKEQALALFKAAGYAIDKSGGIKDGKLVVDK